LVNTSMTLGCANYLEDMQPIAVHRRIKLPPP